MWYTMGGVGSRGMWREAPLVVSREVMGQGRRKVKLTSVITYLRTVMREPSRQIQAYLAALLGLKISSGEIVEPLAPMHTLCERVERFLDKWFVDIACPSSATFFQREGAAYT